MPDKLPECCRVIQEVTASMSPCLPGEDHFGSLNDLNLHHISCCTLAMRRLWLVLHSAHAVPWEECFAGLWWWSYAYTSAQMSSRRQSRGHTFSSAWPTKPSSESMPSDVHASHRQASARILQPGCTRACLDHSHVPHWFWSL